MVKQGSFSEIMVSDKAVTSMLVTDVGDEVCCWQLLRCWSRFLPFWSQKHSKDVKKIEILSPTSNFKSPTSRSHQQHCHRYGPYHMAYIIARNQMNFRCIG